MKENKTNLLSIQHLQRVGHSLQFPIVESLHAADVAFHLSALVDSSDRHERAC